MLIRPAEIEDAGQISSMAKEISLTGGQTNMSYVDFIDSEKLISELTDFDHLMVIETETPPAEICAALLLSVDRQIFLRRTATLKIIVSPKWQGQGIGRALLGSVLELADKELMLERIEVEIPTENVSGLKLCKSAGFKVEGIAQDWAKMENDKYTDAYLMARCKNKK